MMYAHDFSVMVMVSSMALICPLWLALILIPTTFILFKTNEICETIKTIKKNSGK
jgi:hypothetical protein